MKQKKLRNLVLPLIGIAGVLYGLVYAVSSSNPPHQPEKQLHLPPANSFARSISGSGLVEANTRNISVGSQLSGIVSELYVSEGSLVKKGARLFRLDDRTALADIATSESNLAVARARLAEAEVALADQQDQLSRVQKLKEGVSVSADRVARLRFAQRTAVGRLSVAKAAIREAEAQAKAARVTLQKLTVTAPITGRVLKLNTRVGEYVQSGPGATAPLVVGNDTPLHVRVSIDENDLWRFSQDARANGAIRGNRDISFPLTFVRLEPYVIPKTSLTGSMSERVDTRVLEVVYRIDTADIPVYIGQQVDVFIEETDRTAAATETPAETPAK